eukprot:m.171512 g.171512  ORF g.171512 m.171512 type:complete len:51 (+) comp31653_c4_seq1:95-247(+)
MIRSGENQQPTSPEMLTFLFFLHHFSDESLSNLFFKSKSNDIKFDEIGEK